MSDDVIEFIHIRSEEDAFLALRQALNNEIPDTANILFEGWPTFKITLEGEDFNASIPTRIMPPILELQKEIHRIYCRSKYNEESTKRLTDDERKQLELIVQVKAGSSEFITQLGRSLNEIIRNTNMNGTQAVILLVSISGIIASDYAWKDWLQKKEAEHQLDISVRLSQEETTRLEIVTEAMQKNSEIVKTQDAIDELRSDLAKKLQPGDRLKVNSKPIINGNRAAQISSAPRHLSEDIRIDGLFIINEVKFPKKFGEEYRFNVTRISDNKTLTVNASPTKITDEQLAILKNSGFSVKKTLMEINAKSSRGNISQANLVSIEWPNLDLVDNE
jgi:hypothetical protein